MASARRAIRLLGWIQVTLSVTFAVSVIAVYASYSTSLGQMLGTGAAALQAGADAINRTAATVRAQQEAVELSIHALAAGRTLVGEIRTAGEVVTTQVLPPHVENIQQAAAAAASGAAIFKELGTQLAFQVPTRIEMQGVKPIVVYSQPLRDQAGQMTGIGQSLHKLGKDLKDTAVALDAQGKKLGTAASEASQKTSLLLDGLTDNMSRVKSAYLPRFADDLKATETGLRDLGDQLVKVEWFVRAVLMFSLALALLLASNGVLTLVLVSRGDVR